MRSELHIAYLDDVTLGGCTSDVLQDVELVQHCSDELGLQLNHQKSEILCDDISTRDKILSVLPGSTVVGTACATLLSSSLGDVFSISASVNEKVTQLRAMGERLQHLSSHDALLLLRHSLAASVHFAIIPLLSV